MCAWPSRSGAEDRGPPRWGAAFHGSNSISEREYEDWATTSLLAAASNNSAIPNSPPGAFPPLMLGRSVSDQANLLTNLVVMQYSSCGADDVAGVRLADSDRNLERRSRGA